MYKIILTIFVFPVLVFANSVPQFADIVRKPDGSVYYMNQYEASAYCSSQGMHLPSARELAQLSASLGAQGIKELNQFPNEKAANEAGFYLINAQNADNINDSFYFNKSGYSRPEGDLGNYWFMSSSVAQEAPYIAFGLSGYGGHVDRYYYSVTEDAVRCASGI